MNIFYLDPDIQKCVELHCDKHVVKMPLETTQMLCTVHYRYGGDAPYKPVHAKHPCTLWAGNFYLNYRWLWDFEISVEGGLWGDDHGPPSAGAIVCVRNTS